ncbi:MAG: hypothetical protein RR869_08725 [Lachnospiraceae bacterium]
MKKQKQQKEKSYDMELLKRISPAGGIKHCEEYSRTGSGYECCIHIWEFPPSLNDYWLTKLCNHDNTIVAISVHTEDLSDVKKNLNKSIEEQDSRKKLANDFKDFYNAERRQKEMQKLYDEIESMGEVIKSAQIRIYVAAKTWNKLEDAMERIIKEVESNTYRGAVFLNETETEWKAMYLPETKMQEFPHQIHGIPLPANLLAAGNPFHFCSLEDPFGDFLGVTSCGGNIIYDEFYRSDSRVNYSAAIVGNMRFGKSTLLKKRLKARAIRGDFTRTFDITGEFTALTNNLGGRVLNMDGTDGIVNLLEIFKAGENDDISFSRHWTKLKNSYKFLNPDVAKEEIDVFYEVVEALYLDFSLYPDRENQNKKQLTGLPANRYPIFSDMLEIVEKKMNALIHGIYTTMEQKLAENELLHLKNIRSQIYKLVNTYGFIFNGHTSLDNMGDVQIVTYNLSKLKELDSEIFDLQLFNILSICWDNAVTNGTIMKKKWESGEIALEEVVHFMILIDESHRWVNAKKIFALELLSIYFREGPKFFVGIWLASQSIRDYVPEGSTDVGIDTLKTIFELAQYKFIFHQDSNVIPILDRIFNNALTYAQRNRIPQLQRGETILCISGEQNIEFKVYLSKEDDRLFEGGA